MFDHYDDEDDVNCWIVMQFQLLLFVTCFFWETWAGQGVVAFIHGLAEPFA